MSLGDIFKAYDVRGIYPDQFDTEIARAIGSAFASFTGATSIVVARDMRPSGVDLCQAFCEGARRLGVSVIDMGLASTDFLYFGSGALDLPGAMFTASHNPAQYNGIKMCAAGARPIGADTGLSTIESLTEGFLTSPADGDLATLSTLDLSIEWVAHVRSFIDVTKLRPLRVVADTANGMGGLIVPWIFDGLPLIIDVLFGELDGTFPNHPADPIQPDNLRDLQRRVRSTGADVGLAFDGDADRVFLVDENGEPLSGSVTTAMVASAMLQRSPGSTILYNLICSKVVPEIVKERGGTAVRTRVGHSYIKHVMSESGAIFGGEHSGHYYYRDNYRADSGIITALIVLEMLSDFGGTLSQLAAPFSRYAASGEINTAVARPTSTLAALAQKLADTGGDIDTLDGLTVDYGSWWFNVRPSNTEPLLRLNVEAADELQCAEHVKEIVALLQEIEGVPRAV